MSTEVRRPFGVSFLSLVLVALGVLEVVAGVVTLFQRGDSQLLSAIDLNASQITTYAVFTIMYGAIVVLVGLALRTGQSWSRYVVGGLAAVRLASLIWVGTRISRAVRASLPLRRSSAIWLSSSGMGSRKTPPRVLTCCYDRTPTATVCWKCPTVPRTRLLCIFLLRQWRRSGSWETRMSMMS